MTILEYLNDTYIYKSQARVETSSEDEYGQYIILDRTIFYPQWWGQPSDTGTISDGENTFIVEKVRLNEWGIVYHYGKLTQWNIEAWMHVSLEIDPEKRVQNARNHSAGHLIDIAIRRIGLSHLKPTKWYHFPEWCYVEYIGTISEEGDTLVAKLEKEVNRLIGENLPVEVRYPEWTGNAPIGKSPRIVAYAGDPGCGCGGTHVRSSGEIGKVQIRKMKMKDGNLRVSYMVGENN